MFRKRIQANKDTQEKKTPSDVILKNHFGLIPHVYIPLLYIFILIIVIIGISYLNLLLRSGQYVQFKSTPHNAAVFIDNKYLGATPLKTRVKKGIHTLQISMPFYTQINEEIKTRNPLFKFISKTKKITLTPLPLNENADFFISRQSDTKELNKINILDAAINEIASWNISNSETLRFQTPPVLKETLDALKQSYDNLPDSYNSLHIVDIALSLLYESMPYISNNVLDNDSSKLYSQLQSQQKQWKEGYSWVLSLPDYKEYKQIHNNSALFVKKDKLLANFYQDDITERTFFQKANTKTLPLSITFNELRFSKVSSQTLYYTEKRLTDASLYDPIHYYLEYDTESKNRKLTVDVPNFYILNYEITQRNFQTFLDENQISIQAWKKAHILLVSPDHQRDYFSDYDPQSYPNHALRYISWYDANEYVKWLDKKINAQGYRASLPNEYQWMAAQLTYSQETSSIDIDKNADFIPVANISATSPTALRGGLWEWGSSWYSPSPQYADFQGPLYGNEKHIFGGSFFTKSTQYIEETPIFLSRNTAVLPSWANKYIGFRVVLNPTSEAGE